MRAELQAFVVAVQFLTRVPVPTVGDFTRDQLDRAVHHFPWVGLLLGGASAGVLLAAHQLWPPLLAALVTVLVGVLLTGAFHEDGLADTADGLVGGVTVEQRLTVMKDSRVGTYGVLTLTGALALKVLALAALAPAAGAAALVLAHTVGRLTAIASIRALAYVGDTVTGKAKPVGTAVTLPGLGWGAVALLVAAGVALPVLGVAQALAGLGAAVLAAGLLGWWIRRRIGGYTGDTLGATEQTAELGLVLALAAVLGLAPLS